MNKKKNRMISFLLTFAMALTLMPAATITAGAENPAFTGGMTAAMNPGGTGDVWIFANGTAITIEAKGTGTVIKADNNGIVTEVDLAEVTKSLMNGESSMALTNNGENGYDLSHAVIFGGKNNAGQLVADTSITLNGGTVGALVGGSYSCLVTGNTNITINGGTLKGANLKFDSIKNSIYAYFVGGGLGDYGSVGYNYSASSDVSGEANVTINGGRFDTQFEYYTYGYAGGCSYSRYNSVCSANLFIQGGSFSSLTHFYSSQESSFTTATAYAANTGKTPGLYVYCSISGLDGTIKTEDSREGNNHSSYILTCDEGALSASGADKSRMMVIDAANKTYRFGPGVTEACLFADYTIPTGYKLEIPAGVTLTIPNHATITNHGSIVIKGTLTNKGTISGSGSIIRVGEAVYTGGTPAAQDIPSVVAGFSTLTFEPGASRGTTKLTAIDTAGTGNTQYYKYVYSTAGEPTPPTAGASLTSTEGYSAIPAPDAEITVAKNGGYMIAVEVGSTNKIVKYSCIEMTDVTVGGEADYDALETSIVTGGDGENTTRITKEAEPGNTLYYGMTDSQIGTSYAYNTPIDVSSLTAVASGTDISATLGKYLSVYEVDSSTKRLRKFRCLQLTESYFTGFTGGLVADTTSKIIYCNGKTVCISADSFNYIGVNGAYSTISIPKLYVLDNGQWKQAVPKNLPFSEGFGFNEYSLSGKASAEDTGKKGTLYLLSSNMEYNYTHFYWALPRGAADFENFIIPDIAERPGTDNKWIPRYTVGGTINPLDSKQEHLERKYNGGAEVFRFFEMTALTLEEGATLIVPAAADNTSISDELRIYFYGDAADNIAKGSGASIQNARHMAYTPKASFKLLKADGTEFSKDENDKYLVPKNTQVTIVASLGVYGTAANIAALPAVCTSEPAFNSNSDPTPHVLSPYAVGFRSSDGMYWEFYYYGKDDVSISYSGGSDEGRIATLALTLPNINAYGEKEIFVATGNIMTELGGESCVPPQLVDSSHSLQFTLTKQNQAAITASMPESTTYGTDGLAVGASGGSGTGTFSYSSSNTNVATVEASGTITIVGAGNTSISVTKAGDDDYEPRTDTFSLTVNKKTPAGADLMLTPAADLVYSGSPKSATVTAKEGITGLGSVTAIYYEGKGSTVYAKSTDAPTNAGSYKVSADLAAGDNYTAASGLAAGEFTISKNSSWPSPTNGSMDDTANTFTFTPVPGYTAYQFSMDGGATWADCIDADSDSDTITINVGNIAGAVSVRIKETDNYTGIPLASGSFNASLEGSVAISGTTKYGQTLTANVTGAQSNAVFDYVWKAGGTQIAQTSANTLELTMDGLIGKTITVEVSAVPYSGTLTSGETAPVSKADPVGSPSYTAITAGGKTLADAALAIGAIQPGTAGYTLKWVDNQGATLDDTTEVKANINYRWLFTPIDTDNYNTLSGSITLYRVSTGGGSGGSSGGSSSSGSAEPNGYQGYMEVTAYISGNAAATASATNEQIQNAVSAAKISKESELIIKVNGGAGATALSVAIPQAAFGTMINGNIHELVINSGAASLSFDKEALATINRSLNGDVSIEIKEVDRKSLSKEDQDKIKARPVYDLTVKSGEKTISEFVGIVTVGIPYKPGDGEDPNSIVIYYINDSGNLVQVPNCVYDSSRGMVIFKTDHFSKYAVAYNEVRFNDVSGWYENYVHFLAARNIMKGIKANTFSPDQNITRAEVVTILANLSGDDFSGYVKSSFKDVNTKDWYFEEVQWAYENKIITGFNEKFNPKETISRQDMAVIIARYAEDVENYELPISTNTVSFTDKNMVASYTSEAVTAIQRAGIISGNSDGSFAPQAKATRAQTAKIIALLLQNMVD